MAFSIPASLPRPHWWPFSFSSLTFCLPPRAFVYSSCPTLFFTCILQLSAHIHSFRKALLNPRLSQVLLLCLHPVCFLQGVYGSWNGTLYRLCGHDCLPCYTVSAMRPLIVLTVMSPVSSMVPDLKWELKKYLLNIDCVVVG